MEGEGLVLEFSYTDPSTGQKVEVTRPAEFDTYYRMSLIHTDSTNSMYLNDELIVEFSSDGFVADAYGFFAFNDDGYAFSTFVDNVRVSSW